jgi:anti-sigma factor RsiW
MSCSNVEKQLDDYLDGELSEEDRHSVEKHLETCLSCNRSLEQLGSLVESARRLSSEIEPERELWPGIESRIATPLASGGIPERRRTPSRWALSWNPLAAAAVLLLAVALPLTFWQLGRDPAAEPPVAQSAPTAFSHEIPGAAATAMLARSEDGVLLPRTDLLETLEMKRDVFPAETLSAIEEDVRLIDQAIAEVRAALDESPDNRQLELLLAARYQQEVALLNRVNQV